MSNTGNLSGFTKMWLQFANVYHSKLTGDKTETEITTVSSSVLHHCLHKSFFETTIEQGNLVHQTGVTSDLWNLGAIALMPFHIDS